MASVTTRYSAAWTTFWLVTRRNAPRLPMAARMTKAISWALTGALPLRLLPSGPDRRRLGPALRHAAVGPLADLLGQDAVVGLLIRLDLGVAGRGGRWCAGGRLH